MASSIKVLGTGCLKCSTLLHNTQQAMDNLGMNGEIEMVTNINEIVSFGVAVTPALVIDEMVWTSGEVPSVLEIEDIFRKRDFLKETRV